ncbi:5,10-methylenetetrahydrofolate reductase [Actinomycetospora succinea]|uniref:Methylenetetrahydrofolate reductase n=1 Tax=Actinomycetospora succinea TaxID=663603 RepID=A0A4R6VJQ0_9PSEU|nr:methylenetetrahydrofolate reductase C-terminal domain-containing protein [Actinomycetospora succinea]TDQ58749.1 5,10-methylenetetrahydrofolate reductase [Actinomycetospora succinea]
MNDGSTTAAAAPREGCPKRMVFGPCGGVRHDGGCELDAALPCPWVDGDERVPPWPGPAVGARAGTLPDGMLARARESPVVLTDLSVPSFDLPALRTAAQIVAPVSDAVLSGDIHHQPTFPPTFVAAELRAVGGHPWMTLTCRDRNRVVLEQELAGLAALGVEGVLCVTGDIRGPDVRPGVTQVFDLDATRLAHLAASTGLAATVAITPSAPPREARVRVLAEKQRAGASLAVSNHVADPAELDDFLRAARRLGVDLPVLGAVAVFTDEPAADSLLAFPGLAMDPAKVAAVLDAPDPVAAGIDAAVDEAEALLAVPGVVGVNLSGRASSAGHVEAAEIQAEIARRVRKVER